MRSTFGSLFFSASIFALWTHILTTLSSIVRRRFFTSCIDSGVMGVEDLASYRGLYVDCLGMAPEERNKLVDSLNIMVENPSCRVDTSSITSGDASAGELPTSATEGCIDDDEEVAKIFDGGEDLTCASAAASGMCVMIVSNSPQACTCSCPPDGSGPVCQNNDAGLQRTLNDASLESVLLRVKPFAETKPNVESRPAQPFLPDGARARA
eukprot:COSAG04_NODE_7076_length_1196_cov_1.278031_1_plen_210_part_00